MYFLKSALIFILLCYNTVISAIVLSPGIGSTVELQLSPNSLTSVNVNNLTSQDEFVIIAVHSHIYNVSISYNTTLILRYYATGTDVGLVLGRSARQTPLSSPVYLTNANNISVNVLLVLEVYNSNAPIPGGCNMEVSIETAPFLPTSFSPNVLTVEFPLGSWPLNVPPATCDRAPLQYDVYIYYLPENQRGFRTAFDSLSLMTGVSSIEKNGRKVIFSGSPPSKVKFSNYGGTGRIVAVIVRTLTDSSSYIPVLSYGCNSLSEDENETCVAFGTIAGKMTGAFFIFVGLFLTFFGHRFYKSQLFLLGFCTVAVLSYIIWLAFVEMGITAAGMTSVVVGALGGAVVLSIWARWGPTLPILLAAAVLGILFASTVAYTPVADYPILKDDTTFWLAFFCLVLVVPLAVVSFSRLTSILWCSIVGSYIFLVPIDNYIGSNLKYIILNVLRRATDGYFGTTIIDPPFQTKDIILTTVWAALSVTGTAFQWWRERGRAPFPPPPTWPSRGRRLTTRSLESNPTEVTHLLAENS